MGDRKGLEPSQFPVSSMVVKMPESHRRGESLAAQRTGPSFDFAQCQFRVALGQASFRVW
jgi:hypothetical protein